MSWTVTEGTVFCCGIALTLASTAHPITAKTAAAMIKPKNQVLLKTPSFGRSEPRVSRMAKTMRMATAPMYTRICANPANCASNCRNSSASPAKATVTASAQ